MENYFIIISWGEKRLNKTIQLLIHIWKKKMSCSGTNKMHVVKLCKKHLMDALERILSDVSWDHWVFRVSQHHTPSPRWPSQGWSSPDLRPSSSPRISTLNPKPPSGLLCGFARGLNVPPLGHPCNTQTTEDFAKWTSCKASTANFYRLIEGPPASLPALLHQFLVLGTFPLIGFLNTLFPGHSEFQHDQLF